MRSSEKLRQSLNYRCLSLLLGFILSFALSAMQATEADSGAWLCLAKQDSHTTRHYMAGGFVKSHTSWRGVW